MRNFLSVIVGAALMFSASANAQRLDECESVAACLSALDDVAAQTSDDKVREGFPAVAEELHQRLGDEARAELIRRAGGADKVWRNFAQELLWVWPDWRDSDIAMLREILLTGDRPVWPARPLAQIGSQAAIKVLVEALPCNPMTFLIARQLNSLGVGVLEYLLPALEGPAIVDEFGFRIEFSNEQPDAPACFGPTTAMNLVRAFNGDALVIVDDWIAIARNHRIDPKTRIAALHGLAAIGPYLDEKAGRIRPLLRNRNDDISLMPPPVR